MAVLRIDLTNTESFNSDLVTTPFDCSSNSLRMVSFA